MKITKKQLRRIIREEKSKLLKEGPGGTMQGAEERLFNALEEYVETLIASFGGDAGVRELKAEVLSFIDGYFEHAENYENSAEERGSRDW